MTIKNSNNTRRSFGVLNPLAYMQPAWDVISKQHDIHVLRPVDWSQAEADKAVAYCKEHGIEAVGGFRQEDALLHALINAGLGLPAPSRLSLLYGTNKYLMRTLEHEAFFYAPVDPMTETDEEIREKIPDNEWPFMLKNTSLSMGRGVYRIHNFEELQLVLQAYRENTKLQQEIAEQYASIMEGMDPADIPAQLPPFLAEHIESGESKEYCYEGYITPEGKIVHYAFCEEVYLHNHQVMGYMIPPASVDNSIAESVEAWVEKYMAGFVKAGFVNQFFNLEFWIRADGTFKLTEINPRAAHSYHLNYELNCGASLYTDNLRVAAGDKLTDPTPYMHWKAGTPGMKNTMVVLITLNEAGRIGDLVDFEYAEHLDKVEGIVVRHTKVPDDVVVEGDLTTAGVMVLQIWLAADTVQQLVAKEAEIRSNIYKKQQRNSTYPQYWLDLMPQQQDAQPMDTPQQVDAQQMDTKQQVDAQQMDTQQQVDAQQMDTQQQDAQAAAFEHIDVQQQIEVLQQVDVQQQIEVLQQVESLPQMDVQQQIEVLQQVEALQQVDVQQQIEALQQVEALQKMDVEQQIEVLQQVESLQQEDVQQHVEALQQVDVQQQIEVLQQVEALQQVDVQQQIEVLQQTVDAQQQQVEATADAQAVSIVA